MPKIKDSESRIEFVWSDHDYREWNLQSAICVYLTAVCGKRELVAFILEPEAANPIYYPLGSVGICGLKKILMAWEGIELGSVQLGDETNR